MRKIFLAMAVSILCGQAQAAFICNIEVGIYGQKTMRCVSDDMLSDGGEGIADYFSSPAEGGGSHPAEPPSPPKGSWCWPISCAY